MQLRGGLLHAIEVKQWSRALSLTRATIKSGSQISSLQQYFTPPPSCKIIVICDYLFYCDKDNYETGYLKITTLWARLGHEHRHIVVSANYWSSNFVYWINVSLLCQKRVYMAHCLSTLHYGIRETIRKCTAMRIAWNFGRFDPVLFLGARVRSWHLV